MRPIHDLDAVAHARFSVADVAAITKIPVSTLYRWIADERLTVDRRPAGAFLALGEVQELLDLRDDLGAMPRIDVRRV